MSINTPRGLDPNWSLLRELKSGNLNELLWVVQNDDTLDMEIRHNEVHIYYRGGKITGIKESQKKEITAEYDEKYNINDFNNKFLDISVPPAPPEVIKSKDNASKWIEALPYLKRNMDFYIGTIKRFEEREFQQLVVRENNYSGIADSTDYFVCDIEYAEDIIKDVDHTETVSHSSLKFDLILIKLQSKKNGAKVKFTIGEIKYGDSALSSTAGLKAHVQDVENFYKNLEQGKNLEMFNAEMLGVFNQKIELGLVPCLNQKGNTKSFDNERPEKLEPPEFMFIFANHDPDSEILDRELGVISGNSKIDIKIATANFLGAGIYDNAIYKLHDLSGNNDDFQTKFKNGIHRKNKI